MRHGDTERERERSIFQSAYLLQRSPGPSAVPHNDQSLDRQQVTQGDSVSLVSRGSHKVNNSRAGTYSNPLPLHDTLVINGALWLQGSLFNMVGIILLSP